MTFHYWLALPSELFCIKTLQKFHSLYYSPRNRSNWINYDDDYFCVYLSAASISHFCIGYNRALLYNIHRPSVWCLIMIHDDWNKYYLIISWKCAWSNYNVVFKSVLITVINELEGLSRGGIVKPLTSSSVVMASALCEKLDKSSMHNNNIKLGSRSDPQHVAMVTQACKNALTFLKSKNPAVKWVELMISFYFYVIITFFCGDGTKYVV